MTSEMSTMLDLGLKNGDEYPAKVSHDQLYLYLSKKSLLSQNLETENIPPTHSGLPKTRSQHQHTTAAHLFGVLFLPSQMTQFGFHEQSVHQLEVSFRAQVALELLVADHSLCTCGFSGYHMAESLNQSGSQLYPFNKTVEIVVVSLLKLLLLWQSN